MGVSPSSSTYAMVMLRLGLSFCTILPFLILAVVLLRQGCVGWRVRVASVLIALVVGVGLVCGHHENRYEFLDPACYRSMAASFAQGWGLLPVRAELGVLPKEVRGAVFHRPDLPSLDGVFRYCEPARAIAAEPDETAAFQTRPCFFPMLPLAASALGTHFDAFVPVVGTLWFLCLLALGLGAEKGSVARRLGAALLVACVTFFPAWFFRGFHADAVGATLLSGALMALLARPFAGRALLVGFCLSLSVAYHFTMVLYALPIALFAILRSGSWRQTGALALGTLPGIGLVGAGLVLVGNPYFSGGLAGFWKAVRTVPVIGAIALLSACLAVASLVFLVLAHARRIRLVFEAPRLSRMLRIVLGGATLALCLFPFAGGALGIPQLSAGISSFHPIMVLPLLPLVVLALAPYYRDPLRDRSERFLLFTLAFVGIFGFYLKGSELLDSVSGVWSFRRLFPSVILLLPLCLVGFLRSHATTPARLATALLALLPLAVSPRLWVGINDAGADALALTATRALEPYSLVLFDYRERTGAFVARSTRPRFGLPGKDAGALWDRAHATFLGAPGAALVTSYAPCTLELGDTLLQSHALTGSVQRINTKCLYPCTVLSRPITDTLLTLHPATPETAAQRKLFDGGPIGIRGPWKRANRGGYWSSPTGCAIVGPLPRPGHPVELTLELGWFDASGNQPTQTLRVLPPEGAHAEPIEMSLSQPRQTIRVSVPATDETLPQFLTGLWRIEGEAVFYSADFVPAS